MPAPSTAHDVDLQKQLARALDAAARLQREKQTVEQQMRRINEDLVDQLRAQSTHVAQLEAHHARLEQNVGTLEAMLQQARARDAAYEEETQGLREKLRDVVESGEAATHSAQRREAALHEKVTELQRALDESNVRREELTAQVGALAERVQYDEHALFQHSEQERTQTALIDSLRCELLLVKSRAVERGSEHARSEMHNKAGSTALSAPSSASAAVAAAVYTQDQVLTLCNASLHTLMRIQREAQEAATQMREVSSQQARYEARVASLQAQCEAVVEADALLLSALHKALQQREEELRSAHVRLASAQETLSEVELIVNRAQEQLHAKEERMHTLQTALDSKERVITQLRSEVGVKDGTIGRLNAAVKEEQKRVRQAHAAMEAQRTSCVAQLKEAEDALTTLLSEKQRLQIVIDEKNMSLVTVERQRADAHTRCSVLEQQQHAQEEAVRGAIEHFSEVVHTALDAVRNGVLRQRGSPALTTQPKEAVRPLSEGKTKSASRSRSSHGLSPSPSSASTTS